MSEVTSITLKKIPDAITGPGRGKGPLGKHRTFDGQTFKFGPEDDIKEIVSVRAGKTSTTASRKYQETHYSYSNGIIRLFKVAMHIRVEFVRNITQEQFEASATPEMIEFQKVVLGSIGGQLKATAESEKMKSLLADQSLFNKQGETVGGFKGLSNGAKPTKDFVKRCRPVLLQEGAGDGGADATSAQVSNLTTLFGMTNLKTKNLNKVCIAQGSRSEIFDELKRNTNMPNNKLKLEMKNILPAGLTTKIISMAEKQSDDKSAGKTPQTNIVNSVKKEVEAKSQHINKAGFNFNPKGLIPNAGAPAANVFAHFLGKAKAVLSKVTGERQLGLPGVPDGIKIPDGKSVPNLIEGLNEKTGKFSANTNISKLLQKGSMTPKMSPTNVSQPKKTAAGWQGFMTSPTYKFEFIETLDELKDEFEDSKRFQATDANAITVVTVSYLGDEVLKKLVRENGSIKKIDAGVLHRLSVAIDIKEKIRREKDKGFSSAQAQTNANKELMGSNKKIFGLQPHYIILSDGTLQRGRPVDETRDPDYIEFEDAEGDPIVNVCIVAGQSNPVSSEQGKTLKNFLEVVYQILPGVNIYGDYELFPEITGPGIDMEALRTSLGKTNVIDDPKENKFPTRKQISFIIPEDVAKPAPTANKKVEAFSFKTLSKKFEDIDEETGEKIKRDMDKDFAEMENLLGKVQSGEIDIKSEMDKSFLENKDSLAKSIGEENVAAITKLKDEAGQNFQELIPKLNIKSSADALKTNKIFGGS